MRGLLVTLDRARGLAQFVTPAGDAPAPLPAPPALRGTGIASAPGRDHLEVLLVVPGLGGEAAGIRAGDRIIAVDGVPVGSEGCTGRREERGEWSDLTVEREGTTSVVRVALTVLVS